MKITVITVACNSAATIVDRIRSMASPTYVDIERRRFALEVPDQSGTTACMLRERCSYPSLEDTDQFRQGAVVVPPAKMLPGTMGEVT